MMRNQCFQSLKQSVQSLNNANMDMFRHKRQAMNVLTLHFHVHRVIRILYTISDLITHFLITETNPQTPTNRHRTQTT